MPGVDRLGWRHGLLDSVAEARSHGVNSVVLFPKVMTCVVQCLLKHAYIWLMFHRLRVSLQYTYFAVQTPEELKTPTGEEAFNADGLVQRSIRLLKDRFPDLEVCWYSRTHPQANAWWPLQSVSGLQAAWHPDVILLAPSQF